VANKLKFVPSELQKEFTRYGLLHGTVLSVSQDAIVRDKPQGKTGDKLPGVETTTSEPKGQELGYAARISFDRTQMQIRRQSRQFDLGNGRHGGNQDRLTHGHQLFALAAAELQTRELARTLTGARSPSTL
jgi:hypothetical protein